MQEQQPFISEASFEALLGSRPFFPFPGGLLFFHEELQKYVMASFEPDVEYTTKEFYQLPEEAPYQLINGKFVQTMGASFNHQVISTNLLLEIASFVKMNELGNVVHAPMDIVLNNKNVFQPDILFVSVARQSQIQTNRIIGAPEFVVEILSPSTEDKDRTTKMTQYGLYDVVEYWMVNPSDEQIEVYHNQNKLMQLVQTAHKGDRIVSKAIEGFVLDVERVF